MKHILAINGSYRENGIIDQAIDAAAQSAKNAGASFEVVHLRDFPIEFCVNCRKCAEMPGTEPGVCIHHDRMQELVEQIEAADGYVLASPTNFYSVTALFKRFMERLMVYAYWPWGEPLPKMRKAKATKKAVLIASCAAPGILGRFFFATLKQLKMAARPIGAKPAGSIFIGQIATEEHARLPERASKRVQELVKRLV